MKKLKIKSEVIKYRDGIGCCIWRSFDDEDDAGLAWDFNYDELDDIIEHLQKIKETPKDLIPEYDYNTEEEKEREVEEEKENKWWRICLDNLSDLTFQIRPFDWSFKFSLGPSIMTFSVVHKGPGTSLGPFMICLPQLRFWRKDIKRPWKYF